MSSELRLRIASAVVLAAVVLAATWAGGLAFRLFSAVIALLLYYEWSTITRIAEKDRVGNVAGWCVVALVALLTLFDYVNAGAGLLLLVLVAGLAEMAVFRRADGWLVGGIIYAGLSGLSLAAIRGGDPSGLVAMLFLFAVVWATDICAFFIGRALKGPKLAPPISPGKTWSGAIGGTICAVIAGTLLHAAFYGADGLRIPVLALLLSVCSQIGDLGESFIKRRFGVKDSSRLIPGHGGVMDRVDGLVFACFAAFIVILGEALIMGGAGMPAGALLLGR